MDKSDDHKMRRKVLFSRIDINANKLVSLAEMDKGILEVLGVGEMFEAKPAIARAFHAAKNAVKSKGRDRGNDDYIELPEFRVFLVQLRQFFEQWAMFARLDSDGDRRLGFAEFQQAVPLLNQWGVQVADAAASFREIDSDGGGWVLFDEFCVWAAARNLDIDGDDDYALSAEDSAMLLNSDIKVKAEHETQGFKSQNTKLTDN